MRTLNQGAFGVKGGVLRQFKSLAEPEIFWFHSKSAGCTPDSLAALQICWLSFKIHWRSAKSAGEPPKLAGRTSNLAILA